MPSNSDGAFQFYKDASIRGSELGKLLFAKRSSMNSNNNQIIMNAQVSLSSAFQLGFKRGSSSNFQSDKADEFHSVNRSDSAKSSRIKLFSNLKYPHLKIRGRSSKLEFCPRSFKLDFNPRSVYSGPVSLHDADSGTDRKQSSSNPKFINIKHVNRQNYYKNTSK